MFVCFGVLVLGWFGGLVLVFSRMLFLGLLVNVGFVWSWVPGFGGFDGLTCLCSVCVLHVLLGFWFCG